MDENCPVVVLATHDPKDPDSMLRHRKTIALMEDIRARGGVVMAVVNEDDDRAKQIANHCLSVPPAPELLLPILEVVPLQLFSYHVAVANGCDVDRPRNLVKSVVEE